MLKNLSGKGPDKIKKYAEKSLLTVIAASLILTGCGVDGGNYSSYDSTHEISESTSDISRTEELEISSVASSSSDVSEESSFSSSSVSESQSAPESSSENMSDSSSLQSTSSSQQSSSSSEEEVSPPVVVIPDIKIPTSPGIKTQVKDCGVLDYSNSAQGYISARYTGSKSKVKLRMEANGETYTHDLDPNGKTEYYPLSMGNGTYKITIYEQIDGSNYSAGLQTTIDVNISDFRSPYMYPNHYVNYTKSSNAVYKAAELCAGKTGNIEKIAAVFMWVTENITYDNQLAATVKSGYVPNPDTTLATKKGICYDYSALLAAMLRSQGIPTRMVHGYAAPNGIYHAWNEVYTPETGWITPELLLKNNGYNLVDATFYAGSANKQQISDYISNNNYSAVYYY